MTPERWRQVDELFSQTTELPPEEWASFLDRACGADAELRREVEVLLAHDAKGPAAANEDLQGAVDKGLAIWASDADALIGKHVGPYRILERLGKGGMGLVFLAVRDDDQFQKRVAIKIVRSDMDSALILARFRQERQILAGLVHPNIAQLLDGGVTEDGTPFFAMEYVEGGKPIHEYAAANQLDLPQKLRLFQQVCAAVQYAHQNLVVHRDLKPGNILVTADGTVKLLDFGVAKMLDPTLVTAFETGTGMMMITPEYASPEQVRGEPVTTSSDVYMLGAVLYEVLTGQAAHGLKDRSPVEIARVVCDTEITLPSNVEKRIPADLDNVLLKALEKDRQRRYGSVEALNEDLRRYLEGQPVLARQATIRYRIGKFVRRNRIAVLAAAIVMISIVAGATVSVVQARRAERRFQEVRKLANTFLFAFHDKIANLQGSTEAREFVVKTALEYLDNLARESSGDHGLQEELASAYLRVGQVQGDPRQPNLGQTKESLESLRKAVDLAESVLRKAPGSSAALRVIAFSKMQEGDIQTQFGKPKEGAAAQQVAAEMAQRLCAGKASMDDLRLFNQTLLRLGDSLLDEAPREALAKYEQGLAVAGQLSGEPGKSALAQTQQRLGRVAHELGDAEEGIRHYQQAERLTRELIAEYPKNVRYQRELMVITNYLGNYSGMDGYFHLHQPKVALDYFLKAAQMQKQLATGDAKNEQAMFDRAIGAYKLSSIYLQLDAKEAVRQAEHCLETIDPLYQANRETFRYVRLRQNCLDNQGEALLAVGRLPEAEQSFREGLKLAERLSMRTPDDLGAKSTLMHGLADVGLVLMERRQWEESKKFLDRSLELYSRTANQFPKDLYFLRDLAIAQERMGRWHQASGDGAGARTWYERALGSWNQWRQIGKDGPFAAYHVAQVERRFTH